MLLSFFLISGSFCILLLTYFVIRLNSSNKIIADELENVHKRIDSQYDHVGFIMNSIQADINEKNRAPKKRVKKNG